MSDIKKLNPMHLQWFAEDEKKEEEKKEDKKKSDDKSEVKLDFEILKKNVDVIDKFLNEDTEGKKFLQPKLDKYFDKGLKSWQENNLSKIIQTETDKLRAELNPQEDIRDKRIRALEQTNQETLAATKKAQLETFAVRKASDAGLKFGENLKLEHLLYITKEDDIEDFIQGLKREIESNRKLGQEEGKKGIMKDNSFLPGSGGETPSIKNAQELAKYLKLNPNGVDIDWFNKTGQIRPFGKK